MHKELTPQIELLLGIVPTIHELAFHDRVHYDCPLCQEEHVLMMDPGKAFDGTPRKADCSDANDATAPRHVFIRSARS